MSEVTIFHNITSHRSGGYLQGDQLVPVYTYPTRAEVGQALEDARRICGPTPDELPGRLRRLAYSYLNRGLRTLYLADVIGIDHHLYTMTHTTPRLLEIPVDPVMTQVRGTIPLHAESHRITVEVHLDTLRSFDADAAQAALLTRPRMLMQAHDVTGRNLVWLSASPSGVSMVDENHIAVAFIVHTDGNHAVDPADLLETAEYTLVTALTGMLPAAVPPYVATRPTRVTATIPLTRQLVPTVGAVPYRESRP